MEKGVKTSEFWLSLAASAIGFFIAADVFPDTHWSVRLAGAIGGALSQLGYTWSRTVVKKASTPTAVVNSVTVQPAPMELDETNPYTENEGGLVRP